MELVDFELAFKEAASAHKKVGEVSVFNKALITIQKVFSFKAKAFSFCLFYCTLHRHSEWQRHDIRYLATCCLSRVKLFGLESSYIQPWILRFRATHFTLDDGVETTAFYILATSRS